MARLSHEPSPEPEGDFTPSGSSQWGVLVVFVVLLILGALYFAVRKMLS